MKRENDSRPIAGAIARAAILVAIFFFPVFLHAQDNLAGHWEGSVALSGPGESMPVQVDFELSGGDWHATLIRPDAAAAPLYAAKAVSVTGSRVLVILEMGFSSVVLDGNLSGNTIEGDFTQRDVKGKFKLTRKAGAKQADEKTRRRANDSPQPMDAGVGPAAASKTGGRNEGSGAGGGSDETAAVASPRRASGIRDDEGGSRGVIPAQNADSGGPDAAPKFYAVFFASDAYDSADWPHLNNPIDDAKSIAQELRTFYGFQTDVRENQSFSAIKHVFVDDYQKRPFKPNDELLIYFAGHGDFDPDDNRGYVITKDSSPPGTDRDRQIDFPELITWIDKINVGHILLVLDICQGGTIFEPERGAPAPITRDTAAAFQRLNGVKTRKCMTSGGRGAVKDGRAGQGSPFARSLMEVLGQAGPGTDDMVLDVNEVAGKVMKTMGRIPNASTPEYGGCATDKPTSDFYFFWQAPAK